MQSITGFFKKVIAPSDDGDTASNQDNNEENPPKTVEIHKGDNSCVVNESQEELTDDLRVLKDTVYDLIKDIRDPEKPETLEELSVVSEEGVSVRQFNDDDVLVKVVFVPTVPHCSLASIIGNRTTDKVVRNALSGPKSSCLLQNDWKQTTADTLFSSPEPKAHSLKAVCLVRRVLRPPVGKVNVANKNGLCMRQKLVQNLPDKHKLDIFIKKGTHETADEINKQINDKERIAAAMENPNLRDLVNKCIDEEETFR